MNSCHPCDGILKLFSESQSVANCKRDCFEVSKQIVLLYSNGLVINFIKQYFLDNVSEFVEQMN
jgi:hypothetical protein